MEPQRMNEIVTAFRKVSEGAHRSKIEHYPLSDLKAVQAKHHRYAGDRGTLWFKEIEKRITELEEEPKKEAEYKRQRRDVWKDRAIGFCAATLLWIIKEVSTLYLFQ